MRATRRSVLLLFPLCSGCATLAGLPLSPVTGAIGGVTHCGSEGWHRTWGYPLGAGAGAAFGPLLAVSVGWSADAGWVEHGEYGVGDAPAFRDAFDPYGYFLKADDTGARAGTDAVATRGQEQSVLSDESPPSGP